jgi:hypothetical protein
VVRGAVHGERVCAEPARDDVAVGGPLRFPRPGRFAEPAFFLRRERVDAVARDSISAFQAAIKVSPRGERTPS